MAIFNGSTATQGFSMFFVSTVDWNSVDATGAGLYSYISDDGHDIELLGSGFTGGATPTGGTVTSGQIDLNNDNFGSPDIVFSGFSGSLVTMTNSGASGNANGFYTEMLVGDDSVTGSGFNDTLKGLGGNDTILGGNGNDSLVGGAGNDSLDGESGDDTLEGGDGDDVLSDSFGVDSIVGGDGDDTVIVTSGVGSDFFDGGLGTHDLINWSGSGDAGGIDFDMQAGTATDGGFTETMTGFEGLKGAGGDDTILGTSGDNFLAGMGGNDLIQGGLNADTLFGGDGNDTLYSNTQASPNGSGVGDVLSGDAGADSLIGSGGTDTLTGGAGADALNGGAGSDTADYSASGAGVTVKIWAGTGVGGDAQGDTLIKIENLVGSSFNDRLIGLFNQDNVFHGGDGNDYFDGFAGSDSIYGQNGDDRIIGGAGGDLLDGGDGHDLVSYGSSQSAINVNLKTLAVSGGDAAGDTLVAVEGVIGSAFADAIIGDDNYNTIQANGGADWVNGGGGFDFINGHNGADMLIGGTGNDTLIGGLHDDTFRFSPGDGADRINDFGAGGATGNDLIQLKDYGPAFDTFAEVMAAASQQGGDTLIDFGGGDSILLVGINVGQLNAADFSFI
ncbi:MAG: hypothetical protein KDD85_09900 [Parvularculaceae bacterium]|nr:hypothetical protein [Parvularculaceae bacterium]